MLACLHVGSWILFYFHYLNCNRSTIGSTIMGIFGVLTSTSHLFYYMFTFIRISFIYSYSLCDIVLCNTTHRVIVFLQHSTAYATSYTTYTTNRPSTSAGLLIWCSNNNQQESATTKQQYKYCIYYNPKIQTKTNENQQKKKRKRYNGD